MPDFRVASFNTENLFSRAKALNKASISDNSAILAKIAAFQQLIAKALYTPADKARMVQMFNGDTDGIALKDYIEVREDRGKLFRRQGSAVVGIQSGTKGQSDWDGGIEFKRANFNELTRKNTAQVIKDLRADLLCVVEVENRPTLTAFDSHLLNNRYPYELVIDGNDDRGIDVGLLSKQPLGGIRTHIFDLGTGAHPTPIFARDCLEVEVLLPPNKRLHVLCNHFTSKLNGGGGDRRQAQAAQVKKILGNYNLTQDWVIVAGDFNDTPDSAPMQSLLATPHLHDVLALQFPTEPGKRWTYHFNTFDQIDFILVSEPLKARFKRAGVIRKGIHGLKQLTQSAPAAAHIDVESEYPSVTHDANAASDHGAVWADFDLT